MSRYDSDNFDNFFNDRSDNVKGGYEPPRYHNNAGRRRRVDVDLSYNDEMYDTAEFDTDRLDEFSDSYGPEHDFSYHSRNNNSKGKHGDNMYDEDYYEDTPSKRNKRNSDRNSEERRIRNKLRKSKRLGTFIVGIQFIISVVFLIFMNFTKNSVIKGNPLLNIYLCIALIVLFMIPFFMQHGRLFIKFLGKLLSITVSIILVVSMVLYGTIMQAFFALGGDSMVSSKQPFIVFLSGTDYLGELTKNGNDRSDTNILAVVNPKTSTVLLLTTPRDAYLEMVADELPDGTYDKLTHAGIYGTGKKDANGSWEHGYDVSKDTLSKLYDINIDKKDFHHARLNFTGFMNLIDALGGVDIDVPESFSRDEFEQTWTFSEGPTHMTGMQALVFVRVRKEISGGDFQRGKNQASLIKAVIKQSLTPSTIKNYKNIVSAIDSGFETDINLASLATLQTTLMGQGKGDWNVVNYATQGVPGTDYCYAESKNLSIVYLDDNSVEVARQLVKKVLDGDTVTDSTAEEIANSLSNEQ